MKMMKTILAVLFYFCLDYVMREWLGFGSLGYWALSVPNFLLLVMLLKRNYQEQKQVQ
ncbi:TPA: hypothetical protein ACGOTH_000983 [Streptococcus suis]|uniref:hypothetical protein n=1 Tax=Streptococcus suis TaxID=1307 RepID=UPI00137B068C|nr:hypothetical protein [Streptococcus suis]MBY5022789.1 hypothetical protein [Streptococcus suis]